MKKLLALILCVMMFVAIIPTAAFAAYDTTDQRTWAGESQNKKIVEALRTNLEGMYGSYAVDTSVYKTVKGIDDMMKDMVDAMLEGYAPNIHGTMTSSTALNDAILAGLRSTIGGEITDYIDKHRSDYYVTDSLGHLVFNPAKYAGVFSTAASKALTSGKAAAGLQAFMIYAADRAAFNTLSQQAADLRAEMISWGHMGDYGWDDATKGIHQWHVPGTDIDGLNNLDGVLHRIGDSYASVLSKLGQLGVDLNDDGQFGLGFNGWIVTADNTLAKSSADTTERVNTPLLSSLYSWVPDGKGGKVLAETAKVYENTTGTYTFIDNSTNGYKKDGTITIDGNPDKWSDLIGKKTVTVTDPCTGEIDKRYQYSPYFYWTGEDAVCCLENPCVYPAEPNFEVSSWIFNDAVTYDPTPCQNVPGKTTVEEDCTNPYLPSGYPVIENDTTIVCETPCNPCAQ
jgi:hypothetical protein